jgi:hypothetical protein
MRASVRALPPAAWLLFAGTFVNRFGSFVAVFLALYLVEEGFSVAQAGVAIGGYGIGAIAASTVGATSPTGLAAARRSPSRCSAPRPSCSRSRRRGPSG